MLLNLAICVQKFYNANIDVECLHTSLANLLIFKYILPFIDIWHMHNKDT